MTKKTMTPRGAKKQSARKTRKMAAVVCDHPLYDSWQKTSALVSALIDRLQTMQRVSEDEAENWNRLFGAKDSTVMNLQKLVAVMVVISDRLASFMPEHHVQPEHSDAAPMRVEDMHMLQRWLEDEMNALNADADSRA